MNSFEDVVLGEPIIHFFYVCSSCLEGGFRTKAIMEVVEEKLHGGEGLLRVEEVGVEEVEIF